MRRDPIDLDDDDLIAAAEDRADERRIEEARIERAFDD